MEGVTSLSFSITQLKNLFPLELYVGWNRIKAKGVDSLSKIFINLK